MASALRKNPSYGKLVLGIILIASMFSILRYYASDGFVERDTMRKSAYQSVSFDSLWGSWTQWTKNVDRDDRLYRVSKKVFQAGPFNAGNRYDHLNATERRLATASDVCHYYQLDQEESLWGNKSTAFRKGKRNQCDLTRYSVVVDDTLDVLFCFIPKVGCSNFKRYFLDNSGIKGDKEYDLLKMVSPSFYSEKNKYKKIMFTRHPFRRLVSAYLDKLYSPYTKDVHYRKYSVPIMRRYRGQNLDLSKKPRLTFEEFVDYLIETPPSHYNINWMPYWIRCEPCRVKYDYLGQMETMNQDTENLFHTRFANYAHPTNDTDALKMFSQVPREKMLKLYEIYRLDFELFGYSVDEYL